MDKFDMAKKATCLVVGFGVSHIISGVVNSLVPQETAVEKTITVAGRIGIGLVVTGLVTEKVETTMDEYHVLYHDFKKKIQEAKEE